MANNDAILSKFICGDLPPEERLALLDPARPEAANLLVACQPGDYSASAIARAVEDTDAQLLHLAVTSLRDADDRPVIALRVNRDHTEGVSRSLARYGYDTLLTSDQASAALSPEGLRAAARASELLRLLEV